MKFGNYEVTLTGSSNDLYDFIFYNLCYPTFLKPIAAIGFEPK